MKKVHVIILIILIVIVILISAASFLFLHQIKQSISNININEQKIFHANNSLLTSTQESSKVEELANEEALSINHRKKIFSFAQVSDSGTMKYQNEKGGDWIETKPHSCKVISEENPRVIICDNFLTESECEELITLGEPLLQKSGVVANTNKNREIRSSYGGRLPSSNPLVKQVDRRILSMLQMSGLYAERLYLLRYEKGQKYVEHTDGFGGITGPVYVSARKKRYQNWIEKENKKKKKKNSHIHEHVEANRSYLLSANITDGKSYTMTDRAATVLIYLRGDILGGNTSFPMLDPSGNSLSFDQVKEIRKKQKKKNRKKRHHDEDKPNADDDHVASVAAAAAVVEPVCDPQEHFTVAPAVGRLLIFYDMDEDGTWEPKSAHAGCSVLGDKPKFTMTKWLQVPLP